MEQSQFMNDKPTATESDEVANVHAEALEVSQESLQESVLAFIEIPRGSRNKYEYDEERGVFMLDRVLYSSVHYPTDYGFVPDTLAEDGDHLDVCVLMTEPSFPGCLIKARPLGGLDMRDEKGADFKLLAVPENDPRFAHYKSLDQVGKHWLREIETFFATYKLLENKETDILGWHGLDFARQQIEQSREAYRQAKAEARIESRD
jgi:inorganic pyrophosphatase